ncbi:unnamed protein product [Blepharisma stoltei]|uniref:Uncharacterized protein n=1 Tax=Blepharisma stoltei TaxID=1481888 RepID=A0AAU9J5A0_9CILI|nr:unnamed protein product [Blepharisma stoltei]
MGFYNMDTKAPNYLKLLNSQLNPTEEALYNEINDAKNQFNQNKSNQLLNPQQLRIKASAILSMPNTAHVEQEFRKIYSLYENQKNTADPCLSQAYEEYVKAYHQITTLYQIDRFTNNLYIYDTESEREETKALKISNKLYRSRIALLPNGEMLCYNVSNSSFQAIIIDRNYQVQELPHRVSHYYQSAIYFNRSIYCFGGNYMSYHLNYSSRFDLDEYRWIKLSPTPQTELYHNIVFNGNLLIPGNRSLLKYSTKT